MLSSIVSCTTSRLIKPLDKGEKQIAASLGGPLMNLGVPVFLPLSAINFAYGADSNTSVYGDIHLTSGLFGVMHLDAGVLQSIYASPKFGVTSSLQANYMLDFWQGQSRFYPQLDVNAYYNYRTKKEHFVYLGFTNWFELSSTRAHNEEQAVHWIPAVQLGHVWDKGKWLHQFEMKYLAPNYSNQGIVVDYISLGGKGSLGAYYTISRRF